MKINININEELDINDEILYQAAQEYDEEYSWTDMSFSNVFNIIFEVMEEKHQMPETLSLIRARGSLTLILSDEQRKNIMKSFIQAYTQYITDGLFTDLNLK